MKRTCTPIILVVSVILFLSTGVFAQMADKADMERINKNYGFGMKSAKSPFSLIDLSKIRWSHSYSVGFFSGGGQSFSSGLLQSTMFYDFSSSLSMAFSLGVVHDPGSLISGNRPQSFNASLLPGFSLDYHPSEHFNFRIDYKTVSGYNNFFGSFDRPYNPAWR